MIQLVINYWEVKSSAKNSKMGFLLDRLADRGVTHLATFIPWQAVESDITHTLVRFLHAVAERKMKVSLMVSPEVGVHYPHGGVPKDICQKSGGLAQHVGGAHVEAPLPPQFFALPSLLAPEFSKRYHNFLARIDNLLAEIGRTQPKLLDAISVVVTGSYWKYYRDPALSVESAFGGAAGDFSASAAVAYRQGLENYYLQREFSGENLSSVNRWKTREMEDINRRWFYQQCEDVFRNRSAQFLGRRARVARVQQMELYAPEADPALFYSHMLQLMNGRGADFARLSSLLEELSTRGGFSGSESTVPAIHWTGLAGFRTLTDPEKQFLILKSILLFEGRGGDVLIDCDEWFSLSSSFRARAELLSRTIQAGELKLRNRAVYLAPHLWSAPSSLWGAISSKLSFEARLTSSMDYLAGDREATIAAVDPMKILTTDCIERLQLWGSVGSRVVALPRSPLYTGAARDLLERLSSQPQVIRMEAGVPLQVIPNGGGRIVVYDLPEQLASQRTETSAAWDSLAASLLSLAGVGGQVQTSDGRLSAIPLARPDSSFGVFMLNGSSRMVSGDLLFSKPVQVGDLASSISGASDSRDAGAAASSRFALEVPACGVLPLHVSGLEDRVGAASPGRVSSEIEAGNFRPSHTSDPSIPMSELPGFDGGDSVWN